MEDRQLDLRELLQLIDSQKNLNTNLCLDHGCLISVSDPRPLVKAINYMMNFLNEYSGETIEINLNLTSERIYLKLMSLWEKDDPVEIPDQLAEVFQDYQGR